MKELNTIFESHYSKGNHLDPDVSRYYWDMKRLVADNWGRFRQVYKDSLRQKFIDFLKDCGEGEYSLIYIKPVKIEFDYNIKGGYTPGLICGFWLNKKDEPIMFVDCLDGKPLFGVSIDALFDGLSRLRNNVLVDHTCIYNVITKGDIAYTISKSDCQSMRKAYLEKISSDYGQIAETLKNLYKTKQFNEFESKLAEVLKSSGEKYSNGVYIPLKRTGNFYSCFIEQISLIKDTIWLDVYCQGDLSDTTEELKLSDLLKRGKVRLTYKNEGFTVDDDSINDMIDDLAEYLKEKK